MAPNTRISKDSSEYTPILRCDKSSQVLQCFDGILSYSRCANRYDGPAKEDISGGSSGGIQWLSDECHTRGFAMPTNGAPESKVDSGHLEHALAWNLAVTNKPLPDESTGIVPWKELVPTLGVSILQQQIDRCARFELQRIDPLHWPQDLCPCASEPDRFQ